MNKTVTLAAAIALSGCALASSPAVPYMRSSVAMRALEDTGAGKIKHVVFIIQENRSVDNLFHNYPGADTVHSGQNSYGQTVKLKPYSLAGPPYSIDHSAQAMFAACNGTGKLPGTHCRMNGFNNEQSFPGLGQTDQYVYAPHKDTKPYFDMAHEWVLADETFQSQLDESFVAHQYAIAAQAARSVNLPQGKWGCGGGKYNKIATIVKGRDPNGPGIPPCFDYQTLADELDKAGLTWRFYAGSYGSGGDGAYWSSFEAVKHIRYGKDWKRNVISPNWRFITDVRGGKLANFTWITPVCDDSDHVNCAGGYGPSWVAALVNTVGKSKFWDSTAVFVIWDDWGGLYDHVPPPFVGLDGLGFRVPLLVMSPYAKHGHVSHIQYETASVLRFAEDLFGLHQLAAADRRAASPAADCFDFDRAPRAFVKIDAPKPPRFFMRQSTEYQAPDYE
jgi:phospholipase C